MRWLTDAERRRVEATGRLRAYDHVERMDVEELPNGGLRLTAVIILPGNRRLQTEAHDVAIRGDRLERRVSAVLHEPGKPAFRCVLHELIRVEERGQITEITIGVRMRTAGMTRLLRLLGRHDRQTAAIFISHLQRRGDLMVAALASAFPKAS